MTAIEQHNWPGNVRQLLNAIKRASIMADGTRVSAQDLGLNAAARSAETEAGADAPSLDLRQAREAAERQVVLAALARTAGNMARTAEILGVSRPTLYDLMGRLAIRQQIDG
jgi:two-component system, NtrC family, response regulator